MTLRIEEKQSRPTTAEKVANILLPLPFPAPFSYLIPEGMALREGQVVEVPFGSRVVVGVVWALPENPSIPDSITLKPITRLYDIAPLSAPFRRFIQWVAEYNMASLGAVLKLALPQNALPITGKHPKENPDPTEQIALKPHDRKGHALTSDQQNAVDQLLPKIQSCSFSVSLLDGVTGSGKTEVYCALIEKILAEPSGQALVLLPEIALTTQIISRLKARFGDAVIPWHSALTPKRRREYWQAINKGEARLVVGARSALFLPFEALKLIVVDEEHEAAYKQEDGVIYHGRDMAIVRAKEEHIPILLASATPSLESMANVNAGKYAHIPLPTRYNDAAMPTIEIVDMRESGLSASEWISAPLRQAIADAIAGGQQAMLFLNRRGYAPLTLCRSCGHRFACPDCSTWLVAHRRKNKSSQLQCHHCGYHEDTPDACPSCHKPAEQFAACGPGVERIAEEVASFLPEARIAIMTRDTLSTITKAETMVNAITNGEYDVIVGTQIIAKGYHFPQLSLVGVIDADIGMDGGDIRAAERTFQLVHQVAGRAGRERDVKGRVLLQTHTPGHSVIKALAAYDRDAFMAEELSMRERAKLPPFTRLVAIVLSGANESAVIAAAQALARSAPLLGDALLLGPIPPPLYGPKTIQISVNN